MRKLILAALVGLSIACDQTVTRCGPVLEEQLWTQRGYRLQVNDPDRCPVRVPINAGALIDFSGRALRLIQPM